MISPLVTLNRRSCVIDHRNRRPAADLECIGPGSKASRSSLAWPMNSAAGIADGGRGLVARNDFVDTEEIFGVVLALGLRLADEGRCHQLMVALAIVALVRLQLDVVGQLEVLQRGRELGRIDGLFLV